MMTSRKQNPFIHFTYQEFKINYFQDSIKGNGDQIDPHQVNV